MTTSSAPSTGGELDPAEVKACCATGYSSDVVRLLLGDSYHPGGLALTRRLLGLLRLGPGRRLLDVASGLGTSALLAAAEHGVEVVGVDLAEGNVAAAADRAARAGLADRATYLLGDAEALPLPDASVDAVICECSLCTFPGKATAAREMARVLRSGGRVGISDITADQGRLPSELTGVAAWVACVADARTSEEYAAILGSAGLEVLTVEQHTAALARMVDQVAARLELLRITARPSLEAMGLDMDRARPVLDAARAALADGVLGYALLTATKP